MDHKTHIRLSWIELYKQSGDADLVCRPCGISRPALRLWRRGYQAEVLDGLKSRSLRPHHRPHKRIGPQQVAWILALRKRGLGVRRVQSELPRLYRWSASLVALHKVLRSKHVPLPYRRRRHHRARCYTYPMSCERVQMDSFCADTGRWAFRKDQFRELEGFSLGSCRVPSVFAGVCWGSGTLMGAGRSRMCH
jgi:hypothetical protein